MNFQRSIKSLGLAAATAATMMTANIAPSSAQSVPPVDFHLTNKGAYVARFELTYSHAGQRLTLKTGDVTMGNRVSFQVPRKATSIRVHAYYFIGIFALTQGIFDQRFVYVPQNTCFTTFGVTVAPQHNQDCRL